MNFHSKNFIVETDKELLKDCLKTILQQNIIKRRSYRKFAISFGYDTLSDVSNRDVMDSLYSVCEMLKLDKETVLISFNIFEQVIARTFQLFFSHVILNNKADLQEFLPSSRFKKYVMRFLPNLEDVCFDADIYNWLMEGKIHPKKFNSKTWKDLIKAMHSSSVKTTEEMFRHFVPCLLIHIEKLIYVSIIIANKLVSDYKNASTRKLLSLLNLTEHLFSVSDLIDGEYFALEVTNFAITRLPTLYPCVQMLVEIVDNNCSFKFSCDELHKLCFKCLLCFNYNKALIYEQLWVKVKNLENNFYACKLELVADETLVACGIVASSSYLYDRNLSDAFVGILSYLTSLDEKLLISFSSVVLNTLF